MQVEVPWALGPPDGRYLLRGHAGAIDRVVVLRTLGAPPRAGLVRGRRARRASPDPSPVPTGRATLVHPEPVPDGAAWLRAADAEAEATAAFARLNRVLHAHRVATADPWVREVGREQALVVRLGIGAGEQVAEGRWSEAVELPPARAPRRSAALRPQERFAALLGGTDAALACEELVLRARADLAGGRPREAAMQAEAAVAAALPELSAWPALAERRGELAGLREGLAAAAARAREGGLSEDEVAAVAHAVGRLEAALRARSADL